VFQQSGTYIDEDEQLVSFSIAGVIGSAQASGQLQATVNADSYACDTGQLSWSADRLDGT
jgi:hypothetical protein